MTTKTASQITVGHQTPIQTADEYIESLRSRSVRVFLMGKTIDEPVDHPMIRPSINAMAATYELAEKDPELATARSSLTGERVNRFLHVTESAADVVMQNHMQRRLGQKTGTCFQRCGGMDAFNSLVSVTYEIDEAHGTPYHERLRRLIGHCQALNLVVGGAMTDPKGDRGRGPSKQEDPDLYTRIVERREDGILIRGAKAHQTGCVNSHWIVVMPTIRLTAGGPRRATRRHNRQREPGPGRRLTLAGSRN